MKLIIQIPCLNEEQTLPATLAELPREIEGVDEIEWLIVDDGSTDRTVEVARQHGVNYVVRHGINRGLAAAFSSGLNACLQLGADIIVNTDADNQYPGSYIPDLIKPILNGKAEMVIGDRQTNTIKHFSPTKRFLQRWGSAVVRFISSTDVPDAPSGFRAFSRETAFRLHVFTNYTYTLETIIQAGKLNLPITHISIITNPNLRESRLIRSNFHYAVRSAVTLLRLFLVYEPLKTFFYISIPFFLFGAFLWLRYLFLIVVDEVGRGSHLQSIIVGAVALLSGFFILAIGLLGEVNAANRRLQEETLYYLKRSLLSGQPMTSILIEYPSIEILNTKQSTVRSK